jgi:phage tail protein X
MNLSDLQLAVGHATAAWAGYKQALSIAESVSAANPANAEWRIVLARLNQNLGSTRKPLAHETVQVHLYLHLPGQCLETPG